MKNLFWIFANVYGKLFGRSFLQTFHHAVVTSSLHALGYGNTYRDSWTGEEWFMRKVLLKEKLEIVFDVGANIGNYSQTLYKHFDAEIHAFEPNPSAFNKLLELPDKVLKIQAAASDEDGNAFLNFSSEFDEKASLDANVRQGSQIEVTTLKLETYCKENSIEKIDFLKIDTEGFEREVLVGLGSIEPKFIQFEFNINQLKRGYSVYDISTLLPNYKFYRLLPNGWVKINPESYIDNINIFSNYIAIKSDE